MTRSLSYETDTKNESETELEKIEQILQLSEHACKSKENLQSNSQFEEVEEKNVGIHSVLCSTNTLSVQVLYSMQ